jgi:hypothetical protein
MNLPQPVTIPTKSVAFTRDGTQLQLWFEVSGARDLVLTVHFWETIPVET